MRKFTGPEFTQICSALQADERAQLELNRRRHSRLDIDGGRIRVHDVATDRSYTALSRDISFTGISLLQAWPPSTGAEVVVWLPRVKEEPYVIRCTVAHVLELADGLYFVSCTFTGPQEQEKA